MGNLDIAPPAPPKFYKEEEQKKEVPKQEAKKEESPEIKDAPAEKRGFFRNLFVKKGALSEEVDELDLDKIRAQYKIGDKSPGSNWASGDIADEFQVSRPDEARWDVEDPKHLKLSVSSVQKKQAKVEQPKKSSEVEAEKIPIRKSSKPEKPERKIRRGPVDKAIEEYFQSVEKEQLLIEKELRQIVANPKNALRKKPSSYIIHHNEKLVKSMKHLLQAVKSIDDVKFEKKVQANKRAFQNWVQKILDLEKKAENQRNMVFQKKIVELFKVYREGLNKDFLDKKYDLGQTKRDADNRMLEAKKYEFQLKEFDAKLSEISDELKVRKNNINKLIAEKVQEILPSKVKKEKLSLQSEENKLKDLVDEYTEKFEKLKNDRALFEKRKSDAQSMIAQADSLEKLGSKLERKDENLKKQVGELTARENELQQQIKELEAKEKDLSARSKSLNVEIKSLEEQKKSLVEREEELKIELHDFENRKREFDLREKEIREMEKYISLESNDLRSLKKDLSIRERQTFDRLMEAKEIEEEIQKEELNMIDSKKKAWTNFDDYLYGDSTPSRSVDSGTSEFADRISMCKQMIDNNQFREAKKLYSDIREGFLKSDVDPETKEQLYNAIRELYDDLFLAMITVR